MRKLLLAGFVLTVFALAGPAYSAEYLQMCDDGDCDAFADLGPSKFQTSGSGVMLKNTDAGENTVLRVESGVSGYDAKLMLYDYGASNYWELLHDDPDNSFRLRLNGSSKFLVNTDGNVGIGTTDPDYKLDVDESGYGDVLRLQNTYGYMSFGPVASGARVYVSGGGSFSVPDLDVAGDIEVTGDIYDGGGTERISISVNGDLELREDGGSTVFKIDTSGRVGVGGYIETMGSPSPTVTLTGDVYVWTGDLTIEDDLWVDTDADVYGNLGVYGAGTGDALYVSGGDAYYRGYEHWETGDSDVRLKTDIEPLTGALDMITLLGPVEYEWIPDGERYPEGRHWGFIAQDIEDVFPDWIREREPSSDEVAALVDGGLVKGFQLPRGYQALVAQSIKELHAENQTLQQKVWELQQLVCHDHPTANICAGL